MKMMFRIPTLIHNYLIGLMILRGLFVIPVRSADVCVSLGAKMGVSNSINRY